MTHVRTATVADASAIAGFNCAMALETERRHLDEETVSAGVQAAFKRPDYGFYLIAEAEGEPVGCLMITYEWSDWRNKIFWWIQSVYVLPDYRGKGLYRLLYQEVKRLAVAAGNVCGFRLYVERENSRAQRIYEHLGMSEAHYTMYEELL